MLRRQGQSSVEESAYLTTTSTSMCFWNETVFLPKAGMSAWFSVFPRGQYEIVIARTEYAVSAGF